MLYQLFHMNFLFVVLLFFNGLFLISTEDEYEFETTIISLTGPDQPYVYIDQNCSDNSISCSRDFVCTVFSLYQPDIQWYFQPCPDQTCQFEPISSRYNSTGLQSISSTKIEFSKVGYAKCVANNSRGTVEVKEEVVPISNADQRFIVLKEIDFKYEIVPESEEVIVLWNILVQGYPPPGLFVLANNENTSLSLKYGPNVVTNNKIILIIKNASEEVLKTRFQLVGQNIYETRILNLTFYENKQPEIYLETDLLESTYITVKCVATSILKVDISWSFKPCLNDNCSYLAMNQTDSHTKKLQSISYVQLYPSMFGYVRCSAKNVNFTSNVYKQVADVKNGLQISSTLPIDHIDDNVKRLKAEPFKEITLTCGASLFNHSNNVTWAKGDITADIADFKIDTKNTILSVSKIITLAGNGDYGTSIFDDYFCKAWTINGTLESKKIEVTYKGRDYIAWSGFAIIILIILIVSISIFVIIKMRNHKALQKEVDELLTVGLKNFENGALHHLNPNLTIDDQAELLPYDKSYEFPIENLELAEQIGSGAFGVVLKGEAKGIFEHEKKTTVAVKMVNRNIGDIYVKALASELKIMIHLGKHINVVNLLGACTKHVYKRELLVIVEYCRFGNLQNYLQSHRHTFIDQINSETGQIDYTIGSDVLGNDDPEIPYIASSFSNKIYENQTINNDISVSSPSDKDNVVLKADELTQTDQNSHYVGDDQNKNKVICTKDLLVWSFQIARGMEYLASRKVLHGDLAARNVLLTDGNVVKICDFGLAKKMYQNDIYKKMGDEMLPVKWMAIESITDKIFSIQSDVWSFGIVLWEIFSLAKTPYPGMEYNEYFCEKLLSGYRMKCPQFATKEIYEIMLHCWNGEPMERPTFTQLANKIGSTLQDPTRNYYVDMNSGYLKMNAQRFQNDNYLSMISAPNFQQYSSSCCYVNVVETDDENVSTYL